MSDIFFKCKACGKRLVAGDVRMGTIVNCPGCDAAITIPEMLIGQECPHCKEVVKAAVEVRGELVPCPSCQAEVPLPGQPQSIEKLATNLRRGLTREWQRI